MQPKHRRTEVSDARSFAHILAEIGRGDVEAEMSTAMHELVAAVQETEKAGKLTLSLTVKPVGEESVEISVDVKSSTPTNRRPSIFYIDGDGNLTRRNPDQPEFDFSQRAQEMREEERNRE